ncbi:iron ABC transporter permease [uncultured Alsobacter sp.]|uniref:ABC transporter permease n=1 Tax=uncultured Alsobacter sp. TaxID=1748258 RepID=UPI0025E654C7|nr:iron ABC transporter permease [uncultured Alsobacter sp.]
MASVPSSLSNSLGFSRTTVWLVVAVVAVLVCGPLVVLAVSALTPAGLLPFEARGLTLDNLVGVVANPDLGRLLANTALYAAGSMALGTTMALVLAWLTERTDMPGAVVVRTVFFAWMAVPPAVLGFGWILLINPGNGVLNVWSRALLGAEPFTIYSMWALIVTTSFSVTPTAYVMIAGLFRNMDPQLEDAGLIHGARSRTVARVITLPLLAPGLLSVGIYMLIAVVQAFELPLIVGLTARIPVLSTRIFLLSSPDAGVPNYGLAASFGLVLLVLAAVLMWGYFRIVGAGEKYRVVGARGFRARRIWLGRWRVPAGLGAGCLLVVMAMPVLILVWTSFLPFYQTPGPQALAQLTLANYRELLTSEAVRRAALNTGLLVLSSSTLVVLLAGLVAWISVRGRGPLARAADVLSFAPAAIPPVVMAVAILLLYLRTPLYGTMAVLVIGHVTIYLAFGTRSLSGALVQLNRDLTDAALVCGANGPTMLRRIVVPLLRPQLVNAWLWVLAHSARDLTIPIMLMTANTMVVSSVLWTMWDIPNLPGAAALATLLVVVLVVVVVPVQLVLSRRSASAP